MIFRRENHAAIIHDPKGHAFPAGYGDKSNVVGLKGKPVVSTSDLISGDKIGSRETRMRFIAFCSQELNWEDAEQDEEWEDDDPEIA